MQCLTADEGYLCTERDVIHHSTDSNERDKEVVLLKSLNGKPCKPKFEAKHCEKPPHIVNVKTSPRWIHQLSAGHHRGKERRARYAYLSEAEEYDFNTCLVDSGYKTDVGNFQIFVKLPTRKTLLLWVFVEDIEATLKSLIAQKYDYSSISSFYNSA